MDFAFKEGSGQVSNDILPTASLNEKQSVSIAAADRGSQQNEMLQSYPEDSHIDPALLFNDFVTEVCNPFCSHGHHAWSLTAAVSTMISPPS